MSDYRAPSGLTQGVRRKKSGAQLAIDLNRLTAEILADVDGETPEAEVLATMTARRLLAEGWTTDVVEGAIRGLLERQRQAGDDVSDLARDIAVEARADALLGSSLRLRDLLDGPDLALDQVLPGLALGTYGLLVGAGGGCKSTWCTQTAMAVATGRNLCGLLPPAPDTGRSFAPGRGVATFLNLEDHRAPLEVRLQKMLRSYAFSDSERADIVRAQAEGSLRLIPRANERFVPFERDDRGRIRKTRDFEVLERLASASRVLFIDTLNILVSSAGIEENSNTEMGPVATAMNILAEETECAIIVPHHPSKADAMNGTSDGGGRGASAIGDNSRFRLNLRGMTSAEASDRWPDLQGEDLDRTRRSWVHAEWQKASYFERPYPVWLQRHGVVLRGGEPAPAPQSLSHHSGSTGERRTIQPAWRREFGG